MANIFKDVQMANVGSNNFNMTHDVKTSFKMGQLVPIAAMEVIPGDSWSLKNEQMLRLAPLVSPVMHIIDSYIHTFFVPYRILWPEWEDWITGESTASIPTIDWTNSTGRVNPGTAMHYLGYRAGSGSETQSQSAFPFAAYLKIYDEYYRDQNLQSEEWVELIAGNNYTNFGGTAVDTVQKLPLYRAWEHDYFTSALPFAQKGDPVTLPLTNASTAPVTTDLTGSNPVLRPVGVTPPLTGTLTGGTGGSLETGGTTAWLDPNGSLVVDVNNEAVNIATLRRAFRMQEFLEKDARGGTRYIENILSHFGVRGRDRRLQRPHYIGGSKANVQISEVLATAQSSDVPASATSVVGDMAGHGIAVGGSSRHKFSADEHGIIITLISIRPKTAYGQGLHKMFKRADRFDFAWPSFAHIGEQEVLVGELYNEVTLAEQAEVFGYVPRYAEYKYKDSQITGLMATDLEYWHLGRTFSAKPVLNTSFIECVPDTRIFADTTGDHIIGHILNNYKVRRKLPVFGNPTI